MLKTLDLHRGVILAEGEEKQVPDYIVSRHFFGRDKFQYIRGNDEDPISRPAPPLESGIVESGERQSWTGLCKHYEPLSQPKLALIPVFPRDKSDIECEFDGTLFLSMELIRRNISQVLILSSVRANNLAGLQKNQLQIYSPLSRTDIKRLCEDFQSQIASAV